MKSYKNANLGFQLVSYLFIILFFTLTFSTDSYGGNKMELSYLYEENDFVKAISVYPQSFNISSTNISLFTVPQDDSVGTNDISNAITLISFHKNRISYDKYFRNAVDDIGGGGVYIPVISPEVIGFGQVRTFMLYDFKKKIHREFRITMSIAKDINKIAIADARQRHFLFEIVAQKSGSNDPWALSKTLQLIDLSGDKPILIKEMEKKTGTAWSVVGNTIFLYARRKQQLQVLSMTLDPANHPLADEIRRNMGKLDFTWIHPHPYLPFAILSGGEIGSTFISWGKGRDNTPHLFIDGGDRYSFSADGKWLVFREKFIDRDIERTYLMPISEKYPHYLGSPILLSDHGFAENRTAWTTNPVSFVGSWLNEIYRWDLTNQPHPGNNKLSFHEYIVEQDLEKMAKERR